MLVLNLLLLMNEHNVYLRVFFVCLFSLSTGRTWDIWLKDDTSCKHECQSDLNPEPGYLQCSAPITVPLEYPTSGMFLYIVLYICICTAYIRFPLGPPWDSTWVSVLLSHDAGFTWTMWPRDIFASEMG